MWTTSRYASAATRKEANRLAAKSGSIFRARGKKTIAQLAADARKSGDGRIEIVRERGGKPFSVSSIEVLASGRWRWLADRGVSHGD